MLAFSVKRSSPFQPSIIAIIYSIGIENESPLKIEPCLFEWTGWYSDGIPSFVTYDELTTAGYKVDPSYKPYMPASELQVDEEVENYYNRTFEFIKRLLESSGTKSYVICCNV